MNERWGDRTGWCGRRREKRRESLKKKEEETKSGWNDDQTTALIYLYVRYVAGMRSSPLWLPDDVLGLGSLLRQSNATDSSDRTECAPEHEDVAQPVPSPRPFRLSHGDFYVISTSISHRLFCRYNHFRRRGIISFVR